MIGYYDEYEFCVKGIIEVNTPEGVQVITTSGIKETLLRIDAVNTLRRAGRSVTSKVKDDKVLKELTEKISGDIEVISHKATK